VLLDEPTASLDSETEHHVQAAIARLFENRTIVVIAHRLHTVTHADRIHVIENGAIVESGTHDNLLQMGRRYARFYELQLEPKDRKRDQILDVV
jgi:ABC-type multidrug transport system fused ATPase/permease subunit